jgi:cysteine sulfinate desulfinase/cysteine desulfurase-like protein
MASIGIGLALAKRDEEMAKSNSEMGQLREHISKLVTEVAVSNKIHQHDAKLQPNSPRIKS